MFCNKLKEQLKDAEELISDLSNLIFVEETNGPLSARWQFCKDDLTAYRRKWK